VSGTLRILLAEGFPDMLVAERDPFHPGAQTNASIKDPGAASRLARAMSVLQIAGTLLAIPVGLGSAYSMYKTNFSVEATCHSLRSNIVIMLDKAVDPATRHMLVRRDVEAFGQACGSVDPDATAAFKALLAADKKTPVAVAVATRPAEAPPKLVVRQIEIKAEPKVEAKAEAKAETKIENKTEPHPVVAAKPAVAPIPKAIAVEPVHEDAAASDAAWLGAVRQALVTRTAEPAPSATRQASAPVAAVEPAPPAATAAIAPRAIVVPAPPPAIRPAVREIGQPLELRAPAAAVVAPVPALPPATNVASAPAPRADDSHPVPPEAIPDAVPVKDDKPRSRLGALASQIPFVGWAFDR
jgi:hypothetical protein